MSPAPLRVLVLAAVCATCAPFARAQCLNWRAFPHDNPDVVGTIRAVQVHDDGSGPALYVGGRLNDPSSSTPFAELGVMRWDGHAFSQVGSIPAEIDALVVFDDGTGPALYASAYFPARVLKWDGAAWAQLGGTMNNRITCLAVHDDGSGVALYAGGSFFMVGGSPIVGVAKWTGTSWASVGNGPSTGQVYVEAMASYDDGTGAALYVGGTFSFAASPNIARWKANAWSGVGSGTTGNVTDLVAWDDGSGPSLFACGNFLAPGMRIARWSGTAWQPLGGGLSVFPTCMSVLDLGAGAELYVAAFSTAFSGPPGVSSVYRWNGTAWTELHPGTPIAGSCSDYTDHHVNALARFDEGAGPRLFAGTSPGALGFARGCLSRSNGAVWERVGTSPRGVDNAIATLLSFDSGNGPQLYAGGSFCMADEAPTQSFARWDGTTWHAFGSTAPVYVTALATFTSGSSTVLVAAAYDGTFPDYGPVVSSSSNGVIWSPTSTIANDAGVFAAMLQFGPFLYVGGSFSMVTPGFTTANLVRWNGGGFSPVGTINSGANGGVGALATYDDGTGLALYAGGGFTSAGGVAMNRIGRWNSINWSPLGSGMNDIVDALCAFDDGSGSALYAAGNFTIAGGVPALRVASWNGSSWSAVGAGFDSQVSVLGVFDDGSGPALYAGGDFTMSGATPVFSIARWNGTNWTGVGGGISGTVRALCAHDDGTGIGPQLFAGGQFVQAGALRSDNIAAWRGCGGTIAKFCYGDGSDGHCPCSNQGVSGRGCDNSQLTGGARMNATGTTNPDTIELYVAGELPNAATLVFQGTSALSSPLSFGDGLRCAGGSLVRLYTHNAVNGIVSVPSAGDPSISARSASQGDPLMPGAVRTYQAWYRDPVPNFCTPPAGNVWNLSNAVRIVW